MINSKNSFAPEAILSLVCLVIVYPLLGWVGVTELSGSASKVAFWCASGAWIAVLTAAATAERGVLTCAGAVAATGLMMFISAPLGKALTFILADSVAVFAVSLVLSKANSLKLRDLQLVTITLAAGLSHAILLAPAGGWLLTGLKPEPSYSAAWLEWITANVGGALIAVPFIVFCAGSKRQAAPIGNQSSRVWGWIFLLLMVASALSIAGAGGVRWNLEATLGWTNYLPIICAIAVSVLWPSTGSMVATATLLVLAIVVALFGEHVFSSAALSLGQSSQVRWYLAAVAVLTAFFSALARELQASQYEISQWKARYESMVSSTLRLHYDIDLKTSSVLWAGDAKRYFGAPVTQLSTVSGWVSLLHPKDRERFSHQLNAIAEGEDFAPELRYRVLQEDGKYVALLHEVTGVTTFEGAVLRVEGSVQVATKRIRGRLNLYRQPSIDNDNTEGAPRPAVLMIHGIGGSEHDFGPLYKALALHGFDPQPLTLPGHRGHPEDLLKVSAEDWIEAARERYHFLQQRYPVVHVMGISLGALIALEIAKTEATLSGRLILISSPIFIDGWAVPWYYALRFPLYGIALAHRLIKVDEEDPFGVKDERVRAIVAEKFSRGEGYHYSYVPLGCVQQIDRLRAIVRARPSGIGCRTMVIHSREDDLTSAKSAEWLLQHLGADRTQLVLLDNSYHMVCIDNDRKVVSENVLRFLNGASADSRADSTAPHVAETRLSPA